MPNKRGRVAKRPRKRSQMSLKKTLEAAITSNPFLNFFLSKCRVKGNARLHRFAKRAGEQWTDMSYKEKTPYYLMADKAKAKLSRRKLKRRRFSESDTGEGSISTIKVLKKPDSIISSSVEPLDDKKEENPSKGETGKNSVQDDQDKDLKNEDLNGTNRQTNDNSNHIINEDTNNAETGNDRSNKRKRLRKVSISSVEISSGSTSFHSMNSDDSVQKCSKSRKKNTRSYSWTDSFDYMN